MSVDNQKDFLQKYTFQLLAGATVTILFVGTIVFHLIEKWSLLNSYYFSVITLTTVGYGDFTPTTPFGKIFATFYIFLGIGIIATFAQTIVKRRGGKIAVNMETRRENRSDKKQYPEK